MQPLEYVRADSAEAAVRLAATDAAAPATAVPRQFLAGGTTILDLMKLDVMQPSVLVDLNRLASEGPGDIRADGQGLHLGAFVRMAQAAEHPAVRRDYPVVAQSLALAASAQLRNMATLAGNVLQRTRCMYFRHTSWPACNKRSPGSGCAALDGCHRKHAILGVSEHCIAAYPGDFAQALIALDARVHIAGPDGAREIAFADLHRLPHDTPEVETQLRPGELITAFDVPAGPWTRRSLFVKIRDRQSYEFALASAAVALDLDGETVKSARIALGGVATVPWRAREAEQALAGAPLSEQSAARAADAALATAAPRRHNAYKVDLAKRTLVRALLEAARMEVSP